MGVNIDQIKYFQIKLTQPQVIQDTTNQVCPTPDATTMQIPELAMKILRCNDVAPKSDGHFQYHRSIRRLNFIEKITSLDIAYSNHQCARLS